MHCRSRQGGSHHADELGGDQAESKPSAAEHRCAFSCRKGKAKFSSNIEARLKVSSRNAVEREKAAIYRLSEKPVKYPLCDCISPIK